MTTCAKMRRSLVVKVMRQRCATSWCSPGASDTPASRKTCKGPSLSPRRKASNSSGVAMLSRTAPRCFLRHSSSHLWNVHCGSRCVGAASSMELVFKGLNN